MTRVAISGHRGLPADTDQLIGPELARLVTGPDTSFADLVLRRGGCLIAVVPAATYRDGLPGWHHRHYDRLLAAAEIHRLDHADSTADAHMAASELMVDLADELIAVWDGAPARGPGGTADVVAYARGRGVPVHVIWPPGATRD